MDRLTKAAPVEGAELKNFDFEIQSICSMFIHHIKVNSYKTFALYFKKNLKEVTDVTLFHIRDYFV